jgi:hypothetical protein
LRKTTEEIAKSKDNIVDTIEVLTFKDLKKRVSLETTGQHRLFERLRNKPFWIWNIEEHKQQDITTNGICCFDHIIGLPKKDGTAKPIFDYQKILYDALLISDNYHLMTHAFNQKHLWVKKATGLGVTEFFLRLMAWLCLKDDTYRNSQMCIVTGPNIDIAIKLIRRLKVLFEPHNITFANKETVIELNGCTIEAFPSNHWMLIEPWIIPSLFYWMRQTFLESQNRRT